MLRLLFILLTLQLIGCSNGQNKIESEEIVFQRFAKKYDSLRTSLKDSLHSTIQYINDFGGLFSTIEKTQLDSLLKDFKKQSGLLMVVITFDSTMTSKDSVEEVTKIVGIKNRINTTIGISNSHRLMYIWNDSLVNRNLISQFTTKSIIDSIFIPSFREGKYFQGTTEGINKLKKRIIGMWKYQKSIEKKAANIVSKGGDNVTSSVCYSPLLVVDQQKCLNYFSLSFDLNLCLDLLNTIMPFIFPLRNSFCSPSGML